MKRKSIVGVFLFLSIAIGATVASEAASGQEPEDGVVAFYFHGDVRCATCRKLEAYSNEAIEGGFAAEIESGQLIWQSVNVDKEENGHFVTDFQLVTRALVLVEFRGGTAARWKNLDQIWHLVRDKERFVGYVQDSTREFLQEE